jgi:uncharacterized protein
MLAAPDVLSVSVEQPRSLEVQDQRPLPLPARPWTMGQSWLDLLFAHWPVEYTALRPHVPDRLEIETFADQAWLGITPFRLVGLRLRGLPPLPVLSSFLELNVRTYVSADGKPGIWFFSLNASSRLAVGAARRSYALPYFQAQMAMEANGDVAVDMRRDLDGARFSGRYRAVGPVEPPQPGTLEHFLTERYCLYSTRGAELLRAEIHHRPWPLQAAEAELEHELLVPEGVELPAESPLLHFSRRQDVVVWGTETVGAAGGGC